MENSKRSRIGRLIIAALQTRISVLHNLILEVEPSSGIYPSWFDFALLPQFRKIIDLPFDDTSVPDFKPLTLLMDQYSETWAENIKEDLRKKIRASLNAIDPAVDPLELAVGFYWECRTLSCSRLTLLYPEVLAHRCFMHGGTASPHSATRYHKTLMQIPTNGPLEGRLDTQCLAPLVEQGKKIIAAFGLDPATTTTTQMNSLQDKLKLDSSMSECGIFELFSWHAAVSVSGSRLMSRTMFTTMVIFRNLRSRSKSNFSSKALCLLRTGLFLLQILSLPKTWR